MAHSSAQSQWSNGALDGAGAAFCPPPAPTQFEHFARDLGLSPEDLEACYNSRSLCEWAKIHRNRYYIPEQLLAAWRIHVLVDND